MKKVLVTGSNGLLGQKLTDLYLTFSDKELIATAKGPNRHPTKGGYTYVEMDITSRDQVINTIAQYKPDVIINTAAMTNVDACETDKEGCVALNINAVQNLVEAANQVNAHFIHLSTDFIFDGENGPYKESDKPNPLSYYGWSKLEAEIIITNQAKNWAIARTILVYGIVSDMSRSNIVLWAKSALQKGDTMNVVNDQYRMPTLAEDLAMGCSLIEQKSATGVFNISGKDFMSVLEIVTRVADYYGLPKNNINPISSKTLNQAAKRPPKTGFDLTKSTEVLGYSPRSFEEGIALLEDQLSRATN